MHRVYSLEHETLLNLREDEDPPCDAYLAVRVDDRRLISAVMRCVRSANDDDGGSIFEGELPPHVERINHDTQTNTSTVLVGKNTSEEVWEKVKSRLQKEIGATSTTTTPSPATSFSRVMVKVPSVAPLTQAHAVSWSARLWRVKCLPRDRRDESSSSPTWAASERDYLIQNMRNVIKILHDDDGSILSESGMAACILIHPGRRRLLAPRRCECYSAKSSPRDPLAHAVMRAIDAVGKRNCDVKRKRALMMREDEEDADANEDDDDDYLCTGYDAFITHEPCAMCAMALLHSRVARVFWHIPDARWGALGSRVRLHTLKNVNHRYEVYRGFLPEAFVGGGEGVNLNMGGCGMMR